MNFSTLSIKRSVFTYLSVVVIVVLSALLINTLPVSYWPDFTAPVLVVNTRYPGASAPEVEEKVTRVLEAALSAVSGVDEIESVSSDSFSTILVRFLWEINLEKALNDVQEQLDIIFGALPREVLRPQVLKVQNFLPPSVQLSVESSSQNLNDLKKFIQDRISFYFLKLPDVASVEIDGGRDKFVSIEVDFDKLRQQNISVETISAAIAGENVDLAAGKLELNYGEFLVKTAARFKNLEELADLVVAYRQNVAVRLKDVALVRMNYADEDVIFKLNGKRTLGIGIRKKSDGNVVSLSSAVRYELENLKKIYPDLKFTVIKDEALFIRKAIRSVLTNALLGALLAGAVLLFFLKNFSNTVIIALSIPVSVFGSILLMALSGLSLNTISLGGLALAIGMIVDASIVMLENIQRNLELYPERDRLELFYLASKEVTSAIIASILTSLVVFLPLTFLKGIASVLLGELALTIVFALGFSLLVSLGLVPLLAFRLLKSDQSRKETFTEKFLKKLTAKYRLFLGWLVERKIRSGLLLLLVFLLFSGTFFLFRLLKVELIPVPDEGEFRVESRLPVITNLKTNEDYSELIRQTISQHPDVQSVFQIIGRSASLQRLETNVATTYVSLKRGHQPTEKVILTLREKLEQLNIVGALFRFIQSSASEGIVSSDFDLLLFSDNLQLLEEQGRKIYEELQKQKMLYNFDFSLRGGKFELQVIPERAETLFFGYSGNALSRQLKVFYDGLNVGKISLQDLDYEMKIVSAQTGLNPYRLEFILPGGIAVPLNKLVRFNLERGAFQINRLNQQRFAEIKADSKNKNRAALQKLITQLKQKYEQQSAIRIDQRGVSKGISESFKTLGIALMLSLFLVYFVLGAQFNSFSQPVLMAVSIPLALIGMIWTLFITSTALNLNSFLGGIVLAGIAINNGILLIDFINQKRLELDLKTAIVEGAALRIRPILMTVLTTISGMLPLAMGSGEGLESLTPLARAVAGGLVFSTVGTLIVVPAAYYFFSSDKQK